MFSRLNQGTISLARFYKLRSFADLLNESVMLMSTKASSEDVEDGSFSSSMENEDDLASKKNHVSLIC